MKHFELEKFVIIISAKLPHEILTPNSIDLGTTIWLFIIMKVSVTAKKVASIIIAITELMVKIARVAITETLMESP